MGVGVAGEALGPAARLRGFRVLRLVPAAVWAGVRRVRAAPAVIGGVLIATLATAIPAALVVRRALEKHLGGSMAADAAAAGVNYDWWQEFTAQASGLAATFTPSIVGFAAVLRNLSSILDNEPMEYGA